MSGPSDTTFDADLAARARDLYALALDQFIGGRNAAAAEAKRSGDKDLAAALRGLPKPASAAWLVNVLVDRRRAEVEQVLDLGASLREAQEGLDRAQLNALGQQRQRLLAAVAQESLAAASEAGHEVGPAALPGVEQTLRAALADPGAAAAVLTGRLVRTLEASGWDAVDLDGAVGGPFTPPGVGEDGADGSDGSDGSDGDSSADGGSGADGAGNGASGPKDGDAQDPRSAARAARRRKQAEAALVAARASREAAESAADEAHREVERAAAQRTEVKASIEDLERQLDARRKELSDLEGSSADLTQRADEADAELAEAQDEEDAASDDLDQLPG